MYLILRRSEFLCGLKTKSLQRYPKRRQNRYKLNSGCIFKAIQACVK